MIKARGPHEQQLANKALAEMVSKEDFGGGGRWGNQISQNTSTGVNALGRPWCNTVDKGCKPKVRD